MEKSLLLACVGKPSAGKSSFLNAATGTSTAKVGAYPFTTITPNQGVTFYVVDCACALYDKQAECNPRYGKCVNGKRYIPVRLLDVAGLIPGASSGLGLGNKFLDDLRSAHVLIHVVDVSGRTNEKGEATTGYDPSNDVKWLIDEIVEWIFQNLWKKWDSMAKKHIKGKLSAITSLQSKLAGYGTPQAITQTLCDKLHIRDPVDFTTYDEQQVRQLVETFVQVRFPMVVALNKMDVPEASTNAMKIMSKFPDVQFVPTCALAEIYLRKLHSQKLIYYEEGSETFETHLTNPKLGLDKLDEQTSKRLTNIDDMIMARLGGTGVQECIRKAVDTRHHIVVYIVRSLTNFTSDTGTGCFRDCMLVRPSTTPRQLAAMLNTEMEKHYLYAESVSGKRLAEDEPLRNGEIIKITTAAGTTSNVTHKSSSSHNTSNKN